LGENGIAALGRVLVAVQELENIEKISNMLGDISVKVSVSSAINDMLVFLENETSEYAQRNIFRALGNEAQRDSDRLRPILNARFAEIRKKYAKGSWFQNQIEIFWYRSDVLGRSGNVPEGGSQADLWTPPKPTAPEPPEDLKAKLEAMLPPLPPPEPLPPLESAPAPIPAHIPDSAAVNPPPTETGAKSGTDNKPTTPTAPATPTAPTTPAPGTTTPATPTAPAPPAAK
jgi:hypothetical protein